ncbi:MAG: hypothetical protein V3T83_11250, partial [Acidobacteriota bacterium]
MRKLRVIGVLFALFFGACSRQQEQVGEELVYSQQLFTWFEEVGGHFRLSPDARLALFEIRGRVRLVELESGRDISERLRADLDEVHDAVFDSAGGIVRRGRRGQEEGWFAGEEDSIRRLDLPPDARPAWSPEGAQVAFTRPSQPNLLWAGAQGEYRSYDLARQAVSGQGRISGIGWAPESETVYAMWAAESGVSSLFRLHLPDGHFELLAEGLDAEGLDARNLSASIAVSAGGKRVFLSLAGAGRPDPEARHQPHADRDLDIYALDVESATLTPIAQGPGDDFQPQWRDGALFWVRGQIRDTALLIPIQGGEARLLAEGAQMPYWHPGGRKISFTEGGWRLADWALNLDAAVLELDEDLRPSSDPQPLVQGYHEDFSAVWSPDGRWIAYHSHRSSQPTAHYAGPGATDDLYLRSAEGSDEDEIRLTDFGWEVGNPDWSPDSRSLAFVSWDRNDPGAAHCWTVSIDPESGLPQQARRLPLPSSIRNVSWVAWSPQGGEIALVEERGGRERSLWVFDLRAEEASKRIDFQSLTYGGLDWAPDGRTIVYSALGR